MICPTNFWDPTLVEHVPSFLRCGLARQFIVSQPLAYDIRQCKGGPSIVADFHVPIVVAECFLIQIVGKVKRLNNDVGSFDAALQEAPKVPNSHGPAISPLPHAVRTRERQLCLSPPSR